MPDAGPDWDALVRDAGAFGVDLAPEQVEQLHRYLELLCEWNQRFNLTAVEDPSEILVKHFLDSLSPALLIDFAGQRRLIDVGTGAGFPGLVLKIAYPHLQVTLLDSLRKRLGFLERVAADLGLTGVRTAHARAEDAARLPGAGPRGPVMVREDGAVVPDVPLRESFDVVTARAVARLNVLAEWLLPFARVGGAVLAMKGPDVAEEVREAEGALRQLGGGEPVVRVFELPSGALGRSLIRIPKQRATPRAYPRPAGSARRAPL